MPDVFGWETTPYWVVGIVLFLLLCLLVAGCTLGAKAGDEAAERMFSECGGGSPSGPSPVRDGRVSPGPTVAPSQAVADTRSPLPGVGEDGARTVPPTGR